MKNCNNSFKIRNHLPAILPDQIYHTNRVMAVKLASGEYQYAKEVKKTQREKKAIIATLPEFFAGINVLGELAIKVINSCLDYKRSVTKKHAMEALYKNEKFSQQTERFGKHTSRFS